VGLYHLCVPEVCHFQNTLNDFINKLKSFKIPQEQYQVFVFVEGILIHEIAHSKANPRLAFLKPNNFRHPPFSIDVKNFVLYQYLRLQ